MIKAIFFDIDGTLLSHRTRTIPQSTQIALKRLRERGIYTFIATGRHISEMKDLPLDNLEFDGYITLNGQYCYTQDKIIYENTIQKEDLQALLDYLEKYPFPCGFTEEHTKYFNMRDERVDEIHRITHNDDHPAGDCSQVIHHKVYQCMCFVDEQEAKALLKVMPHCISARWHPLFCDVSPVGGTKQNGIDQFLKYYDIDLSETMAFGDGGNDIPMLKHVAISIAMGNANENVKEIANYVTDDVEHDGIIKALKHFNLL